MGAASPEARHEAGRRQPQEDIAIVTVHIAVGVYGSRSAVALT